MMDFTTLFTDHFEAVVVLGCVIVGYLIKHTTFLKWIPNNDIPAILAVLGAVLNCIVGGLAVDVIVYGAFNGLVAVGLHQAFKQFIEKRGGE